MSSLWTPDGERPVGRSPDPGPGDPPAAGPSDGEMADRLAELREELAGAPAEAVVTNHCYGLFELAALYLSEQPPLLDHARLAIDALGCLVAGLEGRLGDAEPTLRDGLSQLRLAYVQIEGARRAGADVASTAGVNGGTGEAPPDAGGGGAPADDGGG